jgi:hypothetical protein
VSGATRVFDLSLTSLAAWRESFETSAGATYLR